jgi:hypothetical protein
MPATLRGALTISQIHAVINGAATTVRPMSLRFLLPHTWRSRIHWSPQPQGICVTTARMKATTVPGDCCETLEHSPDCPCDLYRVDRDVPFTDRPHTRKHSAGRKAGTQGNNLQSAKTKRLALNPSHSPLAGGTATIELSPRPNFSGGSRNKTSTAVQHMVIMNTVYTGLGALALVLDFLKMKETLLVGS